jgi:hypothetical protein
MARKGEGDPERERFWRTVLQKHQLSGLTAKEFCRREQLSEASYYAWRRTLAEPDRKRQSHPRQRGRASGSASLRANKRSRVASVPLFQELAILDGRWRNETDRWLEIVLPDGCRVRVPVQVDRGLLADVLSVLEARRC